MSGALINLVSKGVQDAFIIGDPQVSFFRQNYKRHTNFSMKPVELSKVGTPGPGAEFRVRLSDVGDLISYIWIDAASVGNGTNDINTDYANPHQFELRIGGKAVDRQDAFFIDQLWPKFLSTSSTKNRFPSDFTGDQTFFPLHFFNCDESTTPLPLVALQYHECELVIRCPQASSSNDYKIYANAIFLDSEDREWFVKNEHNLLITQVQKIVADSNGSDLSYFNHPVKCIMWGVNDDETDADISNVRLTINGTDVYDNPMPRKYFTTVQPYMHSEYSGNATVLNEPSLYMHSFAKYANRYQPTGSLNFSRLDNARMKFGNASGTIPTHVYGVNYNVLTIKSGMGGIKFSN